jgi:hypothetical protein
MKRLAAIVRTLARSEVEEGQVPYVAETGVAA